MPCCGEDLGEQAEDAVGRQAIRIITRRRIDASFTSLEHREHARPGSPESVSAKPKSSAKTMIWSMLPSAIAWIGLVGKIVDQRLGEGRRLASPVELTSLVSVEARSRAAPRRLSSASEMADSRW